MPNTTIGLADLEGVTDTVTPIVEGAGLVVESVDLPGGEPPVLRVVVDRESGIEGVDLDVMAGLSESLGQALDAGPLSGDTPYDLEVTSPGADRELTLPRHWARNVTRMVNVVRTDGDVLGGRLLEADAEAIVVEPVIPAPKKGMRPKVADPVRLPYQDVVKGKVDVDATAAMALKQIKNHGEEA